MYLEVECPDASRVSVDGRRVFGRRHLGAAADDSISREQFRIDPVDGVPDVAQLHVLGRNGMVVEMPTEHDSREEDKAWELTEYLDQGMSSLISKGARFYVSSRKASTMFKLHSIATAVILPAGTKRKHTDTELPAGEHNSLKSTSAVAEPDEPSAGSPGASACFQLLRVNGIPHWANRAPGGCRLRDVVHGSMKWVLASNYMVDMTWLLSACPDLTTAGQVVVVHGERTPDRVGAIKAVAASAGMSNVVVHAPPLPVQFGTYHSKAFMIEYGTGVRVIVHTANLIYVDCNNKSQGLWYQDFPPKDAASPATSEFEQELADYLKALRLPAASAQKAESLCRQHDFSSARVQLIISCPGYHSGPALRKYGHLRIQSLLAREKFPSQFQGSPLIAQFSSLGSLDERWLTSEFRNSLSAGQTSTRGKLGAGAAGPEGFQLIWPTVQAIRDSVEGWRGGASVPGPAKNVNKPFLQPYWHKWGGEPWGRQRAMPHIKSYTRYRGQQVVWFILASHNLSKAAWGALQKQNSQLFIRSFELGVMFLPSLESSYLGHPHRGFTCTTHPLSEMPSPQETPRTFSSCQDALAGDHKPLSEGTSAEASAQADPAPMVEFWATPTGSNANNHPSASSSDGSLRLELPIPYKLPPDQYLRTDKPWCVDGNYSGVDSLGQNIDDPVESFYGHVQSPD